MNWIILAVFFSLVFLSCVNSQDEIRRLNEIPDHTTQTIQDVEIIHSDSAKVKVRITGPIFNNVQVVEEPYIEFPNGVLVEFYDDNLNIYSKLKADYAIKYDKKEETIFRNNVEFKNIDNETLITDELIWDQNKKRIYSDGFVSIRTEEEELTGEGFEADEDFTNYRIRNLRGKIKVNKDEINPGL